MEDLVQLYTEIYDLKKKFESLSNQDPGDNDALYKLFVQNLQCLQSKIEEKYDAILATLEGLQFEMCEDIHPIIENKII